MDKIVEMAIKKYPRFAERRIGFIAGYKQAEKDLIPLAQLWVDSGDANVMSFQKFLKCYEAQSNK